MDYVGMVLRRGDRTVMRVKEVELKGRHVEVLFGDANAHEAAPGGFVAKHHPMWGGPTLEPGDCITVAMPPELFYLRVAVEKELTLFWEAEAEVIRLTFLPEEEPMQLAGEA